MPLMELVNAEYAYPGGRQAVAGVSFRLHAGEAVGLVGANGAGKSTLLMLLPGALMATAGEIRVGGVRLETKTAPEVRRKVGLVFQDADDQLFTASVFEDAAFGPRNLGLPSAKADEAAREALALAGAGHLADRAPYRLSGGEKKLAAIAAVLAMGPELLLLDEPSASLDPKARRTVIDLINRLPCAKFVASHDLDLVWDTCSRVLVMKNGKIAADGDTKALLSDEKLMDECGLELPLRLQK